MLTKSSDSHTAANRRASFTFKVFYCLAMLGATVPFGLASSGWVRASIGGGAIGLIPAIGVILFLAIGAYRVFLVVRIPGTLDSPPAAGVAAALSAIGTLCIYVGALVTILNWTARPLMRLVITMRTESGAEYFVVGVYLALAGAVGTWGVLMFEFSRLLSYERRTREGRPVNEPPLVDRE